MTRRNIPRGRFGRIVWGSIAFSTIGALWWFNTKADPEVQEMQAGMFLVARAEPLRRALSVAARLEHTRIGLAAARGLSLIEQCSLVESAASDGKIESLLTAARCAEPRHVMESLGTLLTAEMDIAIASGDGGPWATLRARVDDAGGVTGEIMYPPRPGGLSTLLSPDAAPPGPPLFAVAESAVHARIRVRDGFDFAALTPKAETAEKLKLPDFAGVLSGAVLDGTWEVAVYAPPAGQVVPRMAIALGVRSSRLAESVMNELLIDLESTWDLHRSLLALDAGSGACLPGLTVLPDLAPCWILSRDHIVIGWNRDSLAFALASGETSAGVPETGRFTMDFLTMAAIDNVLTTTAFGDEADSLPSYPWSGLEMVAAGPGLVRISLPVRAAP